MSTSDAGELEPTVVGGETETPLYGTATRTTAAREQQDETFGEAFKQESHHGDGLPAEKNSHQSAIRQKETHKALILGEDDSSHCGDSEVQIQKPVGPRFSSSLLLRLSRSLHFDKPELKENLDPCLHSSFEQQQVEGKDSSVQVNGRTPSRYTSVETTGVYPLSETIPFPAKKEDEVITACNELVITQDLSTADIFSNGDTGSHEHNGLHIPPCLSPPRTCTEVELKEDIKEHTKLENQTDIAELSDPPTTMLSSTVVTVLAPHWSGRLRRTKRVDGTGNSEAQGNLQDVPNTAAQREHGFQCTQNQHGVDRVLIDGTQAQLRSPFLGPRRNTVGWSAKSDPSSWDYETKRQMTHTVSLDVNSGRMDNRKIDAGVLSPLATIKPSVSSLFHDLNEQSRNPQTGHQGGLSPLSSKPTTSSLLLSLRRCNSNGLDTDSASTFSDVNPLPLNSPSRDRNGKLFATHLSQSFLNNNDQGRTKPLLSPSSISYRTTETGPVLPQSSFNHRERNISDTVFFSTSPINRDAGGTDSTQHPQTINRDQPSLTSSKQAFLSKGPLERQLNSRDSDKSTNLLSENTISSARHSPYDHSALLKTHSFPKRTNLKSTSWWKQVSHEGSSPLILNDTTSIKDKLNTPFVPPCNDNSGMTSPSLTDNKTLGSQISSNRDNNNPTESVCKGNMNFIMKTQGGTHNFKQRISENSLDHESHRLVKQQCGSNLNNREPQKPYSIPDALSSSKISRTTAQTTLSHPKDPCKSDASNSSFTASVTELPPTLLNPKSSNTPTESSSKYKNNPCPAKTSNTPMRPQNMDSQKLTKPSLSLDFPTTLSSKALDSQTTSGLPPTTNTKNRLSLSSPPVSSQTSVLASSLSQTPQFSNRSNTTPLGFERTYAPIPIPFQPKTASNLIPTVSSFPKTNYSSASTTSNTGINPVASTSPSPSFISPPVPPAIISSPTTISPLLTPPATPVISSPNYSETSSPMRGKTFPNSPETDPKKRLSAEGKKVRRVTWEDSVDVKVSEPTTVEKPELSRVPTNTLSPSRFSRNAPSIFSFLRPGSPTRSTSPLCSPTPKTSSIQVGKGGKYRSLSSDSADLASREKNKQRASDTMVFDQGKQDLTTPRQERTLSVESGTVQCRSSAPLSLPPDFSSSYKLRYSSPPYSTLMSNRVAHGETNTFTPRARLFSQPSESNYTPQLSLNTTSKPPLSPVRPLQPPPLSSQRKPAMQESSKCVVSESDQVNNNHNQNNTQDRQNSQILLVDNRVHVSLQTLQGDKIHRSSYVTETLVYGIKTKVDTATAPNDAIPKPLQDTANTLVSMETKLSQQSNTVQRKKAAGEPYHHSDQSSSGSSSTESQSRNNEGRSRRMKENVLGKSKFFSVEVNNEQSPKRSRFALKKSVSTPNSSLSKSESERTNKSNKMDQVLNRLRQKFSTRRSEDDSSFPWKWKRTSQTPSVSGSSDVSNVSDNSVESAKTLEGRVQEKEIALKDNEKETEDTDRWTQNRYAIIPSSAVGSTVTGDHFSVWSEKSPLETDHKEKNACAEHIFENKAQVHLKVDHPATHQLDFYKDSGSDYTASNQFLSCRDLSPCRSPNLSTAYAAQFRKSTPSPRSPFSPFSSLSPLTPFSSPEVTDDSVFYSPKLQRRRESPSPCEAGEGISLGGSRRSRVSTGPPSVSPVQDKEHLASSYADLKYGIEPSRSFSVSSVLSSRPSGPGRISTGSRFMSMGDLSQSALSCGGNGRDLNQWSVTPDWNKEFDSQPASDSQTSYFPSDPGKMRSRSLPRSLTKCLANWSSGVSPSQPVTTTASRPAHLWSPNMNTNQFTWDTEGPPTPPPTPPLSPVSRRMSKPPSLSSPTFSSSSGALQQVDSQSSSRGLLPSRGYVSNLSTYEESSDSSSDTTTDDEYYLESDEDKEKETEL